MFLLNSSVLFSHQWPNLYIYSLFFFIKKKYPINFQTQSEYLYSHGSFFIKLFELEINFKLKKS